MNRAAQGQIRTGTDPEHNGQDPGVEASPVHTTGRVDVSCIRCYARNPRQQINPEYQRIKASIRAKGIDQPLVVTREPGADDYVLHTGGNTRLRILQELYEETADERYREVDCLILPWSGESAVLFAHLRENELRGGLPFIDKARAVFAAKSILERELAVDHLSLRQLEGLFRERGFSLSHSMISKMGYAVNTLWPLMPRALSGGLGRPQIERIRALEKAVTVLWNHLDLGDQSLFDETFATLCRRYDGSEWDIQLLRTALENELVVGSDLNQQIIRLALEYQLMGRPFADLLDGASTAPAAEGTTHPMAESLATGADPSGSGVQGKPDGQSVPVEEPGSLAAGEGRPGEVQGRAAGSLEISETDHSQAVGGESAEIVPEVAGPADAADDLSVLQLLRTRLWESANTLASRHGLGNLVISLPDWGLGFLLRDVPPRNTGGTLTSGMPGLVSGLWWQLAACAEITLAPPHRVLPFLDEASVLYRALASEDTRLLCDSIQTPDPGQLCNQLWHQLNQPDWELLLLAIETYRKIKRHVGNTGLSLWSSAEEKNHDSR